MKKISEMNYDELMKLNNEVLTEAELEQLEEHELVTRAENLGDSSSHPGHGWWDVHIKNTESDEADKQIDVFVRRVEEN